MKQILIISFFSLISFSSFSQDSTFWEHTWDYEVGGKETIERDWGREVVTFLGVIEWTSPSGKKLHIRIISSYQQITKANGFNDRSLIALVKTNHEVIKVYDFVKRQNLPLRIEDNKLVYEKSGEVILSALPDKFAARFCVEGLTCFTEITL